MTLAGSTSKFISIDHRSHLKMRKHTLALFLVLLLTFASHGSWCARSAMAEEDADRHRHLRPHHNGKRLLEIQTPRKVGHAAGGSGGGGISGAGGRSGGGATDSRPHNSKNSGAMALPAPATSVLALVFTTAILLSALSF
ncbi:transcription factor SOX-4-like [Hordeum vulgare]|nr:transcription factor SOX-4-like [Hordeum vulgare]